MSAKKWLTIITFIFSIGALCIVLTIGNASKSMAYDIALATFGSALLGFIMSLTEYFTERKSAMEQFWLEGQSALKKLREIRYFQCDAPIDLITAYFKEETSREFNKKCPDIFQSTDKDRFKAKSELKEWFLQNNMLPLMENEVTNEIWDDYYKAYIDKYRKAILDSINSYRRAATIDLGCLDNAYGNMDFLFGNCKLRKDAYSNIYDKLRGYRDVILKEKHHFDLLQSGEGSLAVCIDKMLQLNRTFFSETEYVTEDGKFTTVYQTLFDDIDEKLEVFRCSIYRNTREESPERTPVCGRFIPSNNDTRISNE